MKSFFPHQIVTLAVLWQLLHNPRVESMHEETSQRKLSCLKHPTNHQRYLLYVYRVWWTSKKNPKRYNDKIENWEVHSHVNYTNR